MMAILSDLVGKVVIPAGFEPTACRLGDQEGVRLGFLSRSRKALVLLGF